MPSRHRRGAYIPQKIAIAILALLSILHYYMTVTIVYELGNSEYSHLYETALLIVVTCLLILIRVSISLTSRTSNIAFIAVILAPMLSVFMDINDTELYYAHIFQTFFILINSIFHLTILCANISEWITVLCFMSFIDGLLFVIITISLLFTASHQKNKLLPCNILLEISLLLFAIILIGMGVRTHLWIDPTLITMTDYFIFNIPFLKTYLIWQYMYIPAKDTNFEFIITNSDNDTPKIIHRFYARIHCMSHDIKWQWKDSHFMNESTKLLQCKNGNKVCELKSHKMNTCECWRFQYAFMKMDLENKREYIRHFVRNKNWEMTKYVSIVYGIFSLFAYIYPILWVIIGCMSESEIVLISNEYQMFVVWTVIILYVLFLFGSVGYLVKHSFLTYVAMVYYVTLNLRYHIYVSPIDLFESCVRMEQVNVIMDNLQSDIALIILAYCYKKQDIKYEDSFESSAISNCNYGAFSV